jgi:hypothetical protein
MFYPKISEKQLNLLKNWRDSSRWEAWKVEIPLENRSFHAIFVVKFNGMLK